MLLHIAYVLLLVIIGSRSTKTKTQLSKKRHETIQKNPVSDDFQSKTFGINIIKDCKPCNLLYTKSSKQLDNYVRSAISSFWRNDLVNAFSCCCHAINIDSKNSLSAILAYSLLKSKYFEANDVSLSLQHFDITKIDSSYISIWEILAPIPVSKTELDADPTFGQLQYQESEGFDITSYILSLLQNFSTFSEFVPSGIITWKDVHTQDLGQVTIHFPNVQWDNLAQGTGTSSVFEFQGWARTTTYVRSNGLYSIHCQGVHTIYIRNENMTRILTGDVYFSGIIRGVVDLKIGLVGIFVPLRGEGQMSFSCQLIQSKNQFEVFLPSFMPELLELDDSYEHHRFNHAILLSRYFNIKIQNFQNHNLIFDFKIESTSNINSNSLSVCIASNPLFDALHDINFPESKTFHSQITIASGQVLSIPLELFHTGDKSSPLIYLPCNKKSVLNLIINPSVGNQVKIPLEFKCRSMKQSITLTFLDYDNSIAQMAIIFPQSRVTTCTNSTSNQCINTLANTSNTYPYILSLHGTGITPGNQADAYKMKPSKESDYHFGVSGYFILAPSKFGAHNWEGVGELSAATSVMALKTLLASFSFLPQISDKLSIQTGHSMGGHGAWLQAIHHPDKLNCLAPLSSWISKEHYGVANRFMMLDISISYIDPKLRAIFEMSLQEHHADRFISNLQFMNVYIRVGSRDMTTSAWFSRRMFRLLSSLGHLKDNFFVSLDEVEGKEHWWWDTKKENDGGVVNDKSMRQLYESCRLHSLMNEELSTYRCLGQFSLELVNPSIQHSLCGVRVLQTMLPMSKAVVEFDCKIEDSMRTCILTSRNVLRLEILHQETITFLIDNIAINSKLSNTSHIDICFHKQQKPIICKGPIDALIEKNLITFGPIRSIYSRPLYIVYGTPQNQDLRLIIHDMAIYLANSLVASHDVFVQVISDIDYRVGKYWLQDHLLLRNIIFIGGPLHNKVIRHLFQNRSSDSLIVDDMKHLRSHSPVKFQENGYFSIENYDFDLRHMVMYTFPLVKIKATTDNDHSALGLCIHASTVQGYLHLSRLAWPVVPPMVRAPFSLYFPDFVVVNQDIWSRGFDGIIMAGYWNTTWNTDPYLTYIKA